MENLRGFELLYALEEEHVKSRQDCLVLALHSLMINEGLVCIGVGDEWPKNITDPGTEMLPEGWNNNQGTYSLRYTSGNFANRYLLKIIPTGDLLLINVIKDGVKAGAMVINLDAYVTEDYTAYSTAYKNMAAFATLFLKEVIQPIRGNNPGHSQTNKEKDPNSPEKTLPHRPHTIRVGPSGTGSSQTSPPHAIPEVGGADLNPFSGGRGGGMLFDPRSMGGNRPTLPQLGVGGPGGLPREVVPPGARFDPIGPPIRGPNRPGPSPDHLPIPDYDDLDDLI